MARLPLPVLYPLSYLVYLVIHRLLGYRKEIVSENIKNSFPEKTQAEQKTIIRAFYKYISDLLIETVWTFGLTEEKIRERFIVENPELLDEFFEQNRDVVVILGHYSCWELVLSSLNLYIKHQAETIYVPLTNPEFDKEYHAMRTKFGSVMISKKDFKESFEKVRNLPRAIIFGTDQSPSISKNVYWTNFLNQETAVAKGVESYAKRYNMPVVYAHLRPLARGSFGLRFTLITDDPNSFSDGELTEAHVRMLEQQIQNKPEYWLWSHRRWKKKRSEA